MEPAQPDPAERLSPTTRIAVVIATGGGAGYFPVAPGTAGSVVGLLCVWGLWRFSVPMQIAACLVVFGLGVWASKKANAHFGKVDSSRIVVDEIVGQMITLVSLPTNFYYMALGFLLFRVLDVVKPPPARYFDSRVKNGLGVVMDDVVAGIYANILLQLLMRLRA